MQVIPLPNFRQGNYLKHAREPDDSAFHLLGAGLS